MQWKAEEKSEDTGRNKINLKPAWGPFSRKKFGGPGELSPASPPLAVPACWITHVADTLLI